MDNMFLAAGIDSSRINRSGNGNLNELKVMPINITAAPLSEF